MEENYKPYYLVPPGNYIMTQGEKLSIPVWAWTDPDGDNVIHRFDFGKANTFIEYVQAENRIKFEPTTS